MNQTNERMRKRKRGPTPVKGRLKRSGICRNFCAGSSSSAQDIKDNVSIPFVWGCVELTISSIEGEWANQESICPICLYKIPPPRWEGSAMTSPRFWGQYRRHACTSAQTDSGGNCVYLWPTEGRGTKRFKVTSVITKGVNETIEEWITIRIRIIN